MVRARFNHNRRSRAARTIQRRWRARRGTFFRNRVKSSYRFSKKVQRACMKGDPVQYRLFGVDRILVSQSPLVLMNISNLKAREDITNPMYLRTSRKIKPLSLTLSIRVDPETPSTTPPVSNPFNTVCIALVRHKRSEEIVDADIQNGGAGGAVTTLADKPFLPLNDTPGYNVNVTNMSIGVDPDPHPELLLKYFNPKVVDVIKTWTTRTQHKDPLPRYYKPVANREYFHKYNHKEEWKYQQMRGGATTTTDFPYNNKCYQLIAWSDSGTGVGDHPKVTVACRLTFKDFD